MAQETPWLNQLARTFIGRELTFCTKPSMTAAFPCSDSVEPDISQDELDVDDERPYLYDLQTPVRGLKKGGIKLAYYMRPAGTRLVAAATPDAHPLGILLRAAFGGVHEDAGIAVASSASGTAITLDAGGGLLFPVGSWGLAPIGGSTLPVRVSAVATDVLTLDFGAGSAATATEVMVGVHQYYLTQGSTETLYVQHFKAGSSTNHVYTWKGCIVTAVEFEIARNGLIKVTFTLQAADWEFPTDDVVDVTYGTDTMGRPFAGRDMQMFVQATNLATRTQYGLSKIALKVTTGMKFVESLGGIEGKSGAYRDGERMAIEATLTTETADITPFSTWRASRTALQAIVLVPQGSGTTKRWLGFDIPNCFVYGDPKIVKVGGQLAGTEFTVRAQMRSTSAATELGRNNFSLFFG